MQGTLNPSAIPTPRLVVANSTCQIEPLTGYVPTIGEGVSALGKIRIQGAETRLKVLTWLMKRIPATIPTKPETGSSIQSPTLVRKDGSQIRSRSSDVAGTSPIRTTTASTTMGTLADILTVHGFRMSTHSVTTWMTIPILNPTKP